MNHFDRLPHDAAEVFGAGATASEAYGLLTVDVPAASWLAALRTARDELACGYFDWLSAVDEPGTGFQVSAHLADAGRGRVRHLLIRTTVPHDAPELPTAVDVFAGAAWHERETHEMFGVVFTGHPHLVPLLLPENFEGHPLRKDFVLAARVAKAWPGAKEPGESSADHDGPKRRQMLPPGVPDPNDWGPLKGQLPPAPARPARTPRAGAVGTTGAAAGDRPARRARSVSQGSASQQADAATPEAPQTEAKPEAPQTDTPRAPRRRTDNAPWDRPAPEKPAEGDETADANGTADGGNGTGTGAADGGDGTGDGTADGGNGTAGGNRTANGDTPGSGGAAGGSEGGER